MCNGTSGGGSGSCGEKLTSIPRDGSSWAGYEFQTGPIPEATSGVYVLAQQAGERIFPLFVGEAVDMALRLSLQRDEDGALLEQADHLYWLAQPNPRLRAHIEKVLVEKYAPPRNGGSAYTAADFGAAAGSTRQLWTITRPEARS